MSSTRSSRRKPSKTRKVLDETDDKIVYNGVDDDDEDEDVRNDEDTGNDNEEDAGQVNGNSVPDDLPEGTVVVEPEEVVDSDAANFTGPEFQGRKNKNQVPGEYDPVPCTACSALINQLDYKSMKMHPALKVLICKKCYRYYSSDDFDQDSGGLDEQCRWCAEGGNLLCCDFCSNSFCKACIKRNLGRTELSAVVEADDDTPWKCYVCNPLPLTGLVQSCTKIMKRAEEHYNGLNKPKMTPKADNFAEIGSDIDDNNLNDVLDELSSLPKMLEEALAALKTDFSSLSTLTSGEATEKKRIIAKKLNVIRKSIPSRLECIGNLRKKSGRKPRQDNKSDENGKTSSGKPSIGKASSGKPSIGKTSSGKPSIDKTVKTSTESKNESDKSDNKLKVHLFPGAAKKKTPTKSPSDHVESPKHSDSSTKRKGSSKRTSRSNSTDISINAEPSRSKDDKSGGEEETVKEVDTIENTVSENGTGDANEIAKLELMELIDEDDADNEMEVDEEDEKEVDEDEKKVDEEDEKEVDAEDEKEVDDEDEKEVDDEDEKKSEEKTPEKSEVATNGAEATKKRSEDDERNSDSDFEISLQKSSSKKKKISEPSTNQENSEDDFQIVKKTTPTSGGKEGGKEKSPRSKKDKKPVKLGSSSSSSSSSEESDNDKSNDEDFDLKKEKKNKRREKSNETGGGSNEKGGQRSSGRHQKSSKRLNDKFEKLRSLRRAQKSKKHESDSSAYDSDLERDIEKLAKTPPPKSRKSNNPTKSEKSSDTSEKKTEIKKSSDEKAKKLAKQNGGSDLSSISGNEDNDDDDNVDSEIEEIQENAEDKSVDKPPIETSQVNGMNELARRSLLEEMENNENEDDDDSDIESLSSDDEASSQGKKKQKSNGKKSDESNDKKSKKKLKKKSRLLTINISDDSDVEQDSSKRGAKRKRKASDDEEYDDKDAQEKESSDDDHNDDGDDDSSDSMIGLKSKRKKRKQDKESEDEEEKEDEKKKKGKGKGRRRIKLIKNSSEDADSDDLSDEPKAKRKSKKKKGETDESNDEDDEKGTPGKHRKQIRKLMKNSKLEKTTKDAAKAEEERRKRIEAKQKHYNESILQEVDKSGDCPVTTKLVLEFDEKTKEPIVEVNKDLIRYLKPHQVEAVKFMYDCLVENVEQHKETGGAGCILAHCMGLGKTLSVITLVHTLLDHYDALGLKTCMIMCPLNTIMNWSNEWNKWFKRDEDKFEVYEICGVKANNERARLLLDWQENGGILIIGYEMFRNLSRGTNCRNKKQKQTFRDTLVNPGPDVVVCDEGHLLKNSQSNLSICCNEMKTPKRVVLTGTPLQNNLLEYHCMLSFVKPNLLGTKKEFLNRFVNPINNGSCADSTQHDVKIMKRRAHVLHDMLSGCVQRRDYSALTRYLPPKFEYVVNIRMSPLQMDLYQKYLEKCGYNEDGGGGYMTMGKGARLFADFQKLMQIWTHPWVLKMDEVRQQNKRVVEDDDEFLDDSEEETDISLAETSSESEAERKKKKKEKKRSDKDGDSDVSFTHSESSDSDGEKTAHARATRATRRSRRKAGELSDGEIIEIRDQEISSRAPATPAEWWHPYVTDDMKSKVEVSGKLVVLFEILRMAEEIGDKVLLFSQSLLSLDIIQELLETVSDNPDNKYGGSGSWVEGADYFRLDGSTQAHVRQKFCDNFNAEDNPRARLFMISTRAGSLGINLMAANRVVIFDASWNPSYDLQAMFRSYRFGQNKPVYVYRLIAQGTMEEKIYERQVSKQSLSQRVIDEHQIQRHFNASDLQELYTFKPDRLDDPEKTDKPTPILPKDRFLADLLHEQMDWIVNYHEHDSLLENKVDEELNEDERKAAWEEYEAEKKGLQQQAAFPNYGGFQHMIQQMQAMNTANTASVMQGLMNPQFSSAVQAQLVQLLLSQNPNLTPHELSQRVSAIYRMQMSNQTQQVLAQQELHRRQVVERQEQELARLQQIQMQQRRQQLLLQNAGRGNGDAASGIDHDVIEL
ncbi:uncharacterized protein LOC141905101 [Tubulanus polymorphus]|uniref:uncharacterized protein LOC141905101 n=1 Tax=Tubulanus polymorphus TaxID=672921 RepID=UPI003DA23AE4